MSAPYYEHHLADGRPIPYVADWSSEVHETLRPEPLAENRLAIFSTGTRGQGRPLLGVMNPARQREVMVLSKCQVCRRRLTKLWMVELIEASTVIRGRTLSVLREPASCATCLRLALEACPHLRSARPNVLLVRDRELIITLCRPTGVLEGDPRVPKAGVVSYIKAAPTDFVRFTHQQFLERTPA